MDITQIGTSLAIVVICYLIGLGAKTIPAVKDNYIPVIVGAFGGVLGAVGMYVMPEFPANDIMTSPYPYEFPDGITWNYNSGQTIRQALSDIVVHGSVFVKTGEYYWTYIGKDGKLHITKGMPSRPFMYNTANELREIILETAREVFNS